MCVCVCVCSMLTHKKVNDTYTFLDLLQDLKNMFNKLIAILQ